MKNTGILIIILGIGLVIVTTFTSFTIQKRVDIEKTETPKGGPRNLHWYPLVGIGVLGIGALVLRRSS